MDERLFLILDIINKLYFTASACEALSKDLELLYNVARDLLKELEIHVNVKDLVNELLGVSHRLRRIEEKLRGCVIGRKF